MIYDNYDTPKLSGGTDPAAVDIKGQLSSQRGYLKSELVVLFRFRFGSSAMCVIAWKFCQPCRDGKG